MAPLAGRRLAELLQEQQEPFLLDVYLLENGCSGRILCSSATATCWPGGACIWRLQRLASHGFRRRRLGILRSLLGVFSRRRSPKGSYWRRGALEDAGELIKIKVDAERTHGWEHPEEAKQLSPVSVLELHLDDGFPADDHTLRAVKEEEPSTSGLYLLPEGHHALEVFGQLHGSASSKYKRTNKESQGRRQPALEYCVKEGVEEERKSHPSEQKDQHIHGSLSSSRAGKASRRRHAWRRGGGGVMAATKLAEWDVSKEWDQFDSDEMGIDAEVGEAILDELLEDLLSHIYD